MEYLKALEVSHSVLLHWTDISQINTVEGVIIFIWHGGSFIEEEILSDIKSFVILIKISLDP